MATTETNQKTGRKPLAPKSEVRNFYVQNVAKGYARYKILEMVQERYGYSPHSVKHIISHGEAKKICQL